MTYVEFSTSAGHGTLVEHGVWKEADEEPFFEFSDIDDSVSPSGFVRASQMEITSERYSEFISIHGGEIAL